MTQANTDDILEHLLTLYGWMERGYPAGRFEIRCIAADRPALTRRFAPTLDGFVAATSFIAEVNRFYGIYCLPNPVPPVITKTTTDDDIEIATFQWIDSDDNDLDDLLQRIADRAETPAFLVQTGVIPRPRYQVFWRLASPTRDLTAWSDIQSRLAAFFHTDHSVINPSRLMRVAGTWTFPPANKRAKGYESELTKLIAISTDTVTDFGAGLPAVQKPAHAVVAPPPPMSHDETHVPLAVLQAAFAAIPASDDRKTWLSLGFACHEANPQGEAAWDFWSRASNKYDAADQARTWRHMREGRTTRAALFKSANEGDPNWWRDGAEVETWWRATAARFSGIVKHRIFRW